MKTLSGTRAWLLQRLSAVYLLGFTIYVLVKLAVAAPQNYDAWRGWLSGGGTEVAVLLFFVALLLHSWIGLRDVILDYVHPLGARLAVLGAAALGEIALGLWVVVIFARLG